MLKVPELPRVTAWTTGLAPCHLPPEAVSVTCAAHRTLTMPNHRAQSEAHQAGPARQHSVRTIHCVKPWVGVVSRPTYGKLTASKTSSHYCQGDDPGAGGRRRSFFSRMRGTNAPAALQRNTMVAAGCSEIRGPQEGHKVPPTCRGRPSPGTTKPPRSACATRTLLTMWSSPPARNPAGPGQAQAARPPSAPKHGAAGITPGVDMVDFTNMF